VDAHALRNLLFLGFSRSGVLVMRNLVRRVAGVHLDLRLVLLLAFIIVDLQSIYLGHHFRLPLSCQDGQLGIDAGLPLVMLLALLLGSAIVGGKGLRPVIRRGLVPKS